MEPIAKEDIYDIIENIEKLETELGLSDKEYYHELKKCLLDVLAMEDTKIYPEAYWFIYYAFASYLKGYCDGKNINSPIPSTLEEMGVLGNERDDDE